MRTVTDARVELFDSFRASFEPVDDLSPSEHLVVDTRLPLTPARLREVVSSFEAGPRVP
jgi:hypothetical protein